MIIRPYLGVIILLVIICLPIFAHLGEMPIQVWDEGRLACSALEMYESGDPLVVTYDGQPEMWSTKPPLLIWIQVLFLKAFGISDFVFRLPTALAAVLTCLCLYWFLAKKMNKAWWGIAAVIILVSTPGYVRQHSIRSGDYDSLLCLFTTLYVLCFYLFIHENSKKYFNATIVFLILSCLTKGVAGVIFLPLLVVYAAFKKKLLTILKMKAFYLGVAAFLAFVVGYYVLREQYNPGYIKAVLENEITGRYSKVIEEHKGNGWFYYNFLTIDGFKPWHLLFVVGSVIGFVSKERQIRELTAYLLLCSLGYIIILSNGATKLDWYMVPTYPLLSVLTAISLFTVCELLIGTAFWKKHLNVNLLPHLFIFLLCISPFSQTVSYAINTKKSTYNEAADDAGLVLQKQIKDGYIFDRPMRLVAYDYQSGVEWYLKACKLKDIPVKKVDKWDVDKGVLALVYQDELKSFMEQQYDTRIVATYDKATVYLVNGRK